MAIDISAVLNDGLAHPRRPVGSEELALVRERLTLELEGIPGIDVQDIGFLSPQSTLVRDSVLCAVGLLGLALWSVQPAAAMVVFITGAVLLMAALLGFPTGLDSLGQRFGETLVLAGPRDVAADATPILMITELDCRPAHIIHRAEHGSLDWRVRMVACFGLLLAAMILSVAGGSTTIRALVAAGFLGGLGFHISDHLRYRRFPSWARLMRSTAAVDAVVDHWQTGAPPPVFLALLSGREGGMASFVTVFEVWRRRFGTRGHIIDLSVSHTHLSEPSSVRMWFSGIFQVSNLARFFRLKVFGAPEDVAQKAPQNITDVDTLSARCKTLSMSITRHIQGMFG